MWLIMVHFYCMKRDDVNINFISSVNSKLWFTIEHRREPFIYKMKFRRDVVKSTFNQQQVFKFIKND